MDVSPIRNKVREAMRCWCGHVSRTDEDYIGRRVLKMEPPAQRKNSRSKRRYMNAVVDGRKTAGVQEMETQDMMKWRRSIHCGDP